MIRKIGFWFDYDQTWTFTALYHALAERYPGLSTCGFVMNDRYWDHAVQNLPAGTRLERFYTHYSAGIASTPSPEDLAAFKPWDERLKLARIAYSDRHLLALTHDQIIAALIHLRRVFADFLDAERPDVFVFNCIASQFAHLFYEMLKERGIRVVVPSFVGIGELIYLADNPFLDCPDVWATYAAFKAGQDKPSEAEAGFARRFCDTITAGRPAYTNNAISTEQRKFALPGPAAAIRFLQNHMRYYRTDPTLPGLIERLVAPLRLRLRRRRSRQYIGGPALAHDKPFLYFPLQFEPEIATLVISAVDQRSIIDLIARRIPIGWRLLLKEHPAMAGQRDPAFYRDVLARHPNVAFIDAAVPSLALVRDAQAVFTLNGTVAIEAAALGKPVITQALSRFGGLGLIPRMIDPFAFPALLDAAIAAPPRREDVELALAAFARHCYVFRFSEPLAAPAVLADDNIRAMRDAIVQHLGRD